MDYKSIQFSVDAATGVARLTLNRPDKMNAFTGDMHAELRHALDALQAGQGDAASVRVLVVTGAGRGFCAGQDLADPDMVFTPGQTPPDIGDVVERNFKPLVMRLTNLRVPTIARVQGVAAGAGCSLALACDMVVAAEAASFMLPFSKIGLIPDTGASWAVPQRLGFARAMGLALTAQKLPAAKAADWGLIWECVANDALDGAVDALAAQLAALPTTALVRTRAAMLAAHTATLEQHLSFEALMMRELGHSADYVEGVSAFLEKRPARFNQA